MDQPKAGSEAPEPRAAPRRAAQPAVPPAPLRPVAWPPSPLSHAAELADRDRLRRDPRLPEDLRHDADLLVQEADRTRRIVQNLLDFAHHS